MRVGLNLGLHNAALEQIEMGNSYPWNRVYKMLDSWFKSDTGNDESKASTLRKALVASGFRLQNPHKLQEQVSTQKNNIAAKFTKILPLHLSQCNLPFIAL